MQINSTMYFSKHIEGILLRHFKLATVTRHHVFEAKNQWHPLEKSKLFTVLQNWRKTGKNRSAEWPHLFTVIQLSIDSGCLPRDWITANIIPVHKKGDKHLASNYRPISLTSIVVKVMERIIHYQLSAALESNNHISEAQHGFHILLSPSYCHQLMIGPQPLKDVIQFTACC